MQFDLETQIDILKHVIQKNDYNVFIYLIEKIGFKISFILLDHALVHCNKGISDGIKIISYLQNHFGLNEPKNKRQKIA